MNGTPQLAAHEEAKKEGAQRRVAVECAIVEIAEHLQTQTVFNESVRTTVDGLVD